jgi:hypothetical protein
MASSSVCSSVTKCVVGETLQEDCNLISEGFNRKAGFYNISDLSKESQQLITLRSGVNIGESPDATLCYHHEKLFLSRYESLQKFCCDPFKKHKKHVFKGLKTVDVPTALALKVKPGQKICCNCEQQMHAGKETSSDDELFQPSGKPDDLNMTVSELGCSPLKTAKLSQRDKSSYAKKKVMQITEAVKSKVSHILDVPSDILDCDDEASCNKCEDLNVLMNELKEKCKVLTKQEQITVLTLVPSSWTIDKTAAEFEVSRHLVKRARELKRLKGILSKPVPKTGKKLTQETEVKVRELYESDEYSRMCPGKKDFVSVKVGGVRVQQQKRLLLVNLKELYIEFRKKSELRIGFSKFCDLRPKSCVTVSASGMHSVCVCEAHQNMKLICSVVPGVLDYKEVLMKMVCCLENRNCMLHECSNCPGTTAAEIYISEQFHKDDMDDEDTVHYKQWLHTERTMLVSLQLPVSDFTQMACKSLDVLRDHHYIAKAQAAYLRMTKETLAPACVVILMDFAENYSFVVQDAVQGQHWNNSQATLHPFTVYYKDEGELKCLSICVVSDHLQHNTNVVHAFLDKVLSHLKTINSFSHIFYFTDGAASQYKNYKNLTNLCFHRSDFGIDAEWHFFATSHGKSPCDGIGGTVKRLVARASLQAATTDQILTPEQLFHWAVANIHGIQFFYVSADEIQQHESSLKLEERYSAVKTIPGTRSHHSFVPVSVDTIEMRRISTDNICSVIHLTDIPSGVELQSEVVIDNEDAYQPGQYVACTYDNQWHIGNVVERSQENKDLLINFMERREDVRLIWPHKADKCWVPFIHMLCRVAVPLAEGSTARQYRLSQQDYDHVINLYSQVCQ